VVKTSVTGADYAASKGIEAGGAHPSPAPQEEQVSEDTYLVREKVWGPYDRYNRRSVIFMPGSRIPLSLAIELGLVDVKVEAKPKPVPAKKPRAPKTTGSRAKVKE
jgi:hypothetical protein